jgi:hypothetical protein
VLFYGTARFKNVNNCLNTNNYSYLETSGGQSYNLYLNDVFQHLIRHLWQLKTVVILHRCLIRAVLLDRRKLRILGEDDAETEILEKKKR